MSTNTWKTAITYIAPNEVRLRGYRIDELMGRVDFGQALYLLLRGELPDEKVGRLMTAILVSSIDHGPTPPSVVGARNAASTSAPLNACVAAGVLAINRSHGGAIEDCARTLQDVLREADRAQASLDQAAATVLAEYKKQGIRVAGFGHRLHTADPLNRRPHRRPRHPELRGDRRRRPLHAGDPACGPLRRPGRQHPPRCDQR